MGKKSLALIITFIMVLSQFITLPVNADMRRMVASVSAIKSISDISVTLFQNEKYILPSKVKAQLSNGKASDVAVKWDKKSISTSKPGDYVSLGTVQGYTKKIKLTVKVLAPIASLEKLVIEIVQGEKMTLPSTINAILSDNTKTKVAVIWNRIPEAAEAGIYTAEGVVKGFMNKAIANITVKPKIIKINQLEEKIAQGSNYSLPDKVEAIRSDSTKEQVTVKWNKQKIDTNVEGTTVVEGTVNGYSGKVYMVINVTPKSAKDIAKESGKVLLLYMYDKHGFKIASGSGFIVSSNGLMLTNFHVIDGASKIKAVNSKGEYIDIKGIYHYDKELDIALLQLDSTNEFPYVTLGDSEDLQQGDKVVAIGSPKGLQNSISEGIISGFRKGGRGEYVDLQVSAAISSGSSGGALFNMKGEVVGITYAKMKDAENVNFAIPIDEVRFILEYTDTLSPISTIEKYDEKTAYRGFENFLFEKYDYFWLNDTKIYLDGFGVRDSNEGKTLEILMLISDENGHYSDYQKVMKQSNSKQKEELKIAVQQVIYSVLRDGLDHFKGKEVYVGFYSIVALDKEPSSGVWDSVRYDKDSGKWICGDVEVICTDKNGEYIYKWIQNY